jgi:hypothetical protein
MFFMVEFAGCATTRALAFAASTAASAPSSAEFAEHPKVPSAKVDVKPA